MPGIGACTNASRLCGFLCESSAGHVELIPGADLGTPVGAVIGPGKQIISASADHETRVRELRRRHLDDLLDPLGRALLVDQAFHQ